MCSPFPLRSKSKASRQAVLSSRTPNPDQIFGFSIWSCPTQLFWCQIIEWLYLDKVSSVQAACDPASTECGDLLLPGGWALSALCPDCPSGLLLCRDGRFADSFAGVDSGHSVDPGASILWPIFHQHALVQLRSLFAPTAQDTRRHRRAADSSCGTQLRRSFLHCRRCNCAARKPGSGRDLSHLRCARNRVTTA